MRNSRKVMIFVGLAIGILGLGWWLREWAVDRARSQRYDTNLEKLTGLISIPDEHSPASKFDAIRHFIHAHSKHAEDKEFRKLRGEGYLFVEGIIAHASGEKLEPVHMECSTRSNLMANVLRKQGYKARIVYVFDTDPNRDGKLRSHTFVDVFNPSTSKWESQDPDYDLYWRSTTQGDRVSVFEEAEDLSKIEPCGESHCGWHLVSDEGQAAQKIQGLIDIVSTVDKSANQRQSRFTSRADPNAVFTFYDRQGTFCEIMPKLCGQIVRPQPSPQ